MISQTLRQLRYFDALAGHVHLDVPREAAASHSRPLSMQIKELEEVPGAVLVERGARQVRLTRFGEEAVLRVREHPALARSSWKTWRAHRETGLWAGFASA